MQSLKDKRRVFPIFLSPGVIPQETSGKGSLIMQRFESQTATGSERFGG